MLTDVGTVKVKQYKGHPIYGVGAGPPTLGWCAGCLFFFRYLTHTIKTTRLVTALEFTFKDKHQAEAHGLKLCRDWIDEQKQREGSTLGSDAEE